MDGDDLLLVMARTDMDKHESLSKLIMKNQETKIGDAVERIPTMPRRRCSPRRGQSFELPNHSKQGFLVVDHSETSAFVPTHFLATAAG